MPIYVHESTIGGTFSGLFHYLMRCRSSLLAKM